LIYFIHTPLPISQFPIPKIQIETDVSYSFVCPPLDLLNGAVCCWN